MEMTVENTTICSGNSNVVMYMEISSPNETVLCWQNEMLSSIFNASAFLFRLPILLSQFWYYSKSYFTSRTTYGHKLKILSTCDAN